MKANSIRSRHRRERLRAIGAGSRRTNAEIMRDAQLTSEWFTAGSDDIKVVEETEAAVVSVVHECESVARMKFAAPDNFHIEVRFDWREARRRSRGGIYSGARIGRIRGPGVNLKMRTPCETLVEHFEYERLSPFGDIGAMGKVPYITRTKIVAIHECAHAIQYSIRSPAEIAAMTEPKTEAHGIWFSDIYSTLRRELGFVKDSLPMYHTLTLDQKARLFRVRHVPDRIVEFLTDPLAYRKHQKLESRRRIRENASANSE